MKERTCGTPRPRRNVLDLKSELAKKKVKILDGIKDMAKLPDAHFHHRSQERRHRGQEARKLRIPIFAVVDTNCNPDDIDFPIPGNDDAIRAIALFLDVMSRAIVEGQSGGQGELIAEEGEESEEGIAAAADGEETAEAAEPEKKASKDAADSEYYDDETSTSW